MADLGPDYFALVMSTGIVSIGLLAHGLDAASVALMWLTAAVYAILVALTCWRLPSAKARITLPAGVSCR